MYGRSGLDRFKKAQSLEPFSVNSNSASKSIPQIPPKGVSNSQIQQQHHVSQKPLVQEAAVPSPGQSQVGGGQSSWQPPDWAIEPRAGVYYLEVMKEGEVLDRINLDRRRNIFGRQFQTCDFVLDHQSVSRQHAAVVPHKNGSVFVIDLGSAHGTFVANERLIKDTPVELEVGQSLRFAASTRTYILRKNNAALFTRHPPPVEINLPSPPDPSDEEALVTYNTLLNRYGLSKSDVSKSDESGGSSEKRDESDCPGRARKRMKKLRVTFKDHAGGELVEVVGISDGVDVETEPGPLGVKEGSLVGKYESLVQTTIIPKGKEQSSVKGENSSQKGISDKLREVFDKVKNVPKGGIYDDLYGETFPGKLGTSWAYASGKSASPTRDSQGKTGCIASGKSGNSSSTHEDDNDDDDDDLFGD